MNAVLYTQALEPITVVDIPMWAWERLLDGQHITLEVLEPMPFVHAPAAMWEVTRMLPRVTIFGELLRRGRHESLMLFTEDEEHALRLQADFLPGQRGELQDRERGAFARGFVAALRRMAP